MDKSDFDPRVAHTGFMVEQVTRARVFLQADLHYPANMILPVLCVYILLTLTLYHITLVTDSVV
jgi:hypothetical protein